MTKEEIKEKLMAYFKSWDGIKSTNELCEEICEILSEKSYEDGLNDAWEAGMKLACTRTVSEWEHILGTEYVRGKGFSISAKEAITKINEYEEAETKEQVNQWDEIYYNSNPRHKAVIINISKENEWNCLDKDNEMVSIDTENQKYWHKTGKNYLECTNVLEQLRGENNDN